MAMNDAVVFDHPYRNLASHDEVTVVLGEDVLFLAVRWEVCPNLAERGRRFFQKKIRNLKTERGSLAKTEVPVILVGFTTDLGAGSLSCRDKKTSDSLLLRRGGGCSLSGRLSSLLA